MRATLLFQAFLQFTDSDGNPLSGGSLEFYVPGTTTPKNIYTDNTKMTTLPNPLDLDTAGQPSVSNNPVQIWLNGAYRIKIKDSDGNVISGGDMDNVTSIGVVNQIANKTSNYTIVESDSDKVFLVDATSGNVTLTLPNTSTVGSGFMFYVKKIDSSSNTVTLAPVSAQTIDSASSFVMTDQNQAVTVISDSNWSLITSTINTISNVITVTSVASAVNKANITNSATGNGVIYGVTGTDTNIDYVAKSQGAGAVVLDGGTGAITKLKGASAASGRVRFYEQTGNGTNYVALAGPASIGSDLTFTLPTTDGSANYALVTNGSAGWSFIDITTLFTNSVMASLLGQTVANPGHIRLGSLKACFGTGTFGASTSLTVTFESAFSSTPYAVIITPHANFTPYVNSYNSTTATIGAANSNSNTISYLVIGPA